MTFSDFEKHFQLCERYKINSYLYKHFSNYWIATGYGYVCYGDTKYDAENKVIQKIEKYYTLTNTVQ